MATSSHIFLSNSWNLEISTSLFKAPPSNQHCTLEFWYCISVGGRELIGGSAILYKSRHFFIIQFIDDIKARPTVYYSQSYIQAKTLFFYKFTCQNMKVYDSENNIWQKGKIKENWADNTFLKSAFVEFFMNDAKISLWRVD